MPLSALGICRRRDALRAMERTDAELSGVRWCSSGELACAVAEASGEALTPIRHAAALEAIHRRMCVLPMRFGTVLDDETQIDGFLEGRSREFLERLDELEGASEMAIRLTLPQPDLHNSKSPPQPLTYLEQRRGHYRRVDAAEGLGRLSLRRLAGHLQGTVRAERVLPAPPQVVRLALLVDRDRIAAFRAGVETFVRSCRRTRCTVLGPWPPYSFV